MKPKEYVSKYKMDVSEYFDHSMFVADLAIDFQSSIEYQKSVGQYTLSHFENIVKQIKQKFDSISFKSKMGIDKWDKLWKFFYATVVGKAKDADFGEQIKKQKQAKQEEWRRKNEWRSWSGFDAGGSFHFGGGDDIFERIFKSFFGFNFGSNGFATDSFDLHIGAPVKEFGELGLVPENATVESVNCAFRKLALQHHPDKGGDASKFQTILESKNRCIMYLERIKV